MNLLKISLLTNNITITLNAKMLFNGQLTLLQIVRNLIDIGIITKMCANR